MERPLIARPERTRERTAWGRTPLHTCRSVEVAELLLTAGADLDAVDDYEPTPLAWICATGRHKDVRDFLIQRGARADAEDIFAACLFGDLEAVTRFIAADPGVVNRRRSTARGLDPTSIGGTPLYEAARRGEDVIVELLLSAGADVNAGHATNGATPLHVSAALGQVDTVLLLLEAAADAAATDTEFGATPAAWARFFRQDALAERLTAP